MGVEEPLRISGFSLGFDTCTHNVLNTTFPVYHVQDSLLSWECSFCLFWCPIMLQVATHSIFMLHHYPQ